MQGGAQLGVVSWGLGEKEAVVIDVESQGQASSLEGRAQEIQVDQEIFPLEQAGVDVESAVVVQQVEQARLPVLVGQPTMGRGVILPELAHLLRLPAAHGFAWSFCGRGAKW